MSSKLTKHNRIKKIGHQIHRKHYITPNNLSLDLADWWNRNNHKKDTSSRGVTTFFAKSVWIFKTCVVWLWWYSINLEWDGNINVVTKKISTHWGRATHLCVSKLTIIGSDNGLSPGRRQAIIWTNDGILLIGPLRTNFSEILSKIQTFSFKKMHLKTSSAQCVNWYINITYCTINI